MSHVCWVVYIPFVHMVKFKFLVLIHMDHLAHPVVSSLILFSTNLLHLHIMWLMVSSLSPHNLHLLFCCILSILTLIWLVLMVLFVLLLGEILFLSWGFLFLDMSTFSHVRYLLLAIWNAKKSCFSSHFCFLVIIILLVCIIIICSLLRVFHTSVGWCFLTGVWVTTNLLKSPGLFSVF